MKYKYHVLIVLLISIVSIFSMPVLGADEKNPPKADDQDLVLKDVSESTPLAKEIYYFTNTKLILPYKNDTFKPNYVLNRSQFITMVVALTESQGTQNYSGVFVDVPENYWAAPFIERAVSKNLIAVPENRKFYPKALETEKEAVDVINKLLPLDKSYFNLDGSGAQLKRPYDENAYLTRVKVVEILANTQLYKDKIEKFSKDFKVPKSTSDEAVKTKILNNAISKYLGNNTNSDELINDLQNIKKQQNSDELINEKLGRALKLINEWKFYDAIKECNEVLSIDSKNILALMRRGSAYYMLDDYDRAREDWNTVLSLDKDNKLVKSFLAQEGAHETQSTTAKRIELEQAMESRLQEILRKRLNLARLQVNLDLEIGANTLTTLQEKSVLPGVPAAEGRSEKYFIKDLKVQIDGNESLDDQQIKSIQDIVVRFFDFPVELNRNLFITSNNFSTVKGKTSTANEQSLVGGQPLTDGEKLFIEEKINENNKYLESKFQENLNMLMGKIVQTMEMDKKFSFDTQQSTVAEVRKIVDGVRLNYSDVNTKVAKLRENLDIQEKKQNGLGVGHYISIASTLLFLVMMFLFFFILKKSLPNIATAVDRLAEKTGKEEATAGGAAAGGAGASLGNVSVETTAEVDGSGVGEGDVAVRQSTQIVGYFDFIDDGNIFKLRSLLKTEFEQGLIDIEKISIIVSYLNASMANIILAQFGYEEQVEILSYLVYSNQYIADDIEPLDKRIKEKLACLVGGREVVLGLLNQIRDNEKTELTKVMADKFPDVLEEIRDMILLFEDLLLLDDAALKQIFSVTDPHICANAIVHIHESDRDHIKSVLSPGMLDMVNQVLELRGKSITNLEIIDAQEHIVKVAKHLSKKGVITLIRKSFGSVEKSTQSDIDALINQTLLGGVENVLIADDMDADQVIDQIDHVTVDKENVEIPN